MEPDIRDLIKKNLELTKENHKMLKKMRRNAFLGGIIKLLWLAVIIGVPVFLYVNYLSPILDQVLGAAQTVQEVGGKVESIPEDIQGRLEESGLGGLLDIFKRE